MATEPFAMLVHGWMFAVALLFVLWVVQWVRTDAGVVDVGWTLGTGVLPAYYALGASGWEPRRALVAALTAAWALRLCWYIVADRIVGHEEEDGRYQRLRKHWGDNANRNFFWFFESQSLLIVLFSVPMLVVAFHPEPRWTLWDALGALLWTTAIGGEWIADRQLQSHRRSPMNRGRTCRSGLWRYSRHPNYFFEWIHWWAYVAMAVGAPYWGVTLIGPAVMFLFLFKVTGIPYTEMQALASRGDDYRRYQEETSIFFPWFPRASAASANQRPRVSAVERPRDSAN